jgi:hypothetical protein
LYFLTLIAGLIIGFVAWFTASRWIAASIAWIEDQRPQLVGSRQLRIAEAVACGVLFLACLALSFSIAWLIWIEIK